MVTAKEINLEMLRAVAGRLEPLLDQLVFLGGCTTALFVTDGGAPDVRVTRDVDVIVEVVSRGEYWQLEERLRELGCEQSLDEQLTCRWQVDGITVDIMPTDEKILGFSNRWYLDAIHTAQNYELSDGLSIRLVTSSCFLATKLEAFAGRGAGDYRGSHDLEDVITVIDGRPEIVTELSMENGALRSYIAQTIGRFVEDVTFREALSGYLPPDRASQERVPIVWKRLVEISELKV